MLLSIRNVTILNHRHLVEFCWIDSFIFPARLCHDSLLSNEKWCFQFDVTIVSSFFVFFFVYFRNVLLFLLTNLLLYLNNSDFIYCLNRKILTPESQLKKAKANQKTQEQIAAERAARKAVCL